MVKWLFVVLWCFVSLYPCEEISKNYYIPSIYHKSHWGFQVEIAKEIAARGHSVIIDFPEEFKDSGELPNPEDLPFASVQYSKYGVTPEDMQDIIQHLSEASVTDPMEQIEIVKEFIHLFGDMAYVLYRRVLDHAENNPTDVVLSDVSPGLYAACPILKEKYNTTCILTTPFISRNPDANFHLGDTLPLWMPATFLGKDIAKTFTERLEQQLSVSGTVLMGKIATKVLIYRLEEDLIERGYDPSILYQLQPIIVNSFQGLDWNIPLYPHVKYIGPLNLEHIEATRDIYTAKHEKYELLVSKNQELTNEDFDPVDLYLESNKNIVVISFGKSVELSVDKIRSVVEFISSIQPTPVLWTIRERHLHLLPDDLPSNLRIETWVNLIGVMSHIHTSLLISQCGVATAHEAILTQTPLLCIPFLFDQFDIVTVVKHNKLGEVLEKEMLSADSLKELVEYMIAKKEEYQRNAMKLTKLAELKPSIAEVVNWIETINEIGAEFVLPPVHVNQIPFYYYQELYIIALVSALVFIHVVLYCIHCCCCKNKPSFSLLSFCIENILL